MLDRAESDTWSEGRASSPLSRQFRVSTPEGRNSLVVRKMNDGDGRGVIVRELWIAGEPQPRAFHTDADFAEAVKTAGLPTINIEGIRRSVASTLYPD